jgi:methenyltetrahydrofolate cyclohydrolase
MARLTDRPFRELLAEFASTAPTPGGGSAAALSAAVAFALLTMVARMPRTRTGSEAERATLKRVGEETQRLGEHAVELVDDDATAYQNVVAAYRLPKAGDDEKDTRRDAIEAALRGAAEVPLEVVRACQAGLVKAIEVAQAGNPAAGSDVAVAVELLMAATRAAALNVRVNLKSIREVGYVDGARAEVERLEGSAAELASEARAALAVTLN